MQYPYNYVTIYYLIDNASNQGKRHKDSLTCKAYLDLTPNRMVSSHN